MGFYDSYRKLMECSKTESEKNAERACQTVKDNFYSLPNVYSVYKNGDSGNLYDVVINKGVKAKDSGGYKTLLSYPYDDIKFATGDYIHWTYGGSATIWLLTSLDLQYECEIKGRIYQCNNVFKIQTGSVDSVTGYDGLGRPIVSSTPEYYEVSCVYSEKIATIGDSDLGNSINIPQGHILVDYQYDSDTSITSGMTFTMNGIDYIIVGVDNSNVFNDIGYTEILAKEVLTDENA